MLSASTSLWRQHRRTRGTGISRTVRWGAANLPTCPADRPWGMKALRATTEGIRSSELLWAQLPNIVTEVPPNLSVPCGILDLGSRSPKLELGSWIQNFPSNIWALEPLSSLPAWTSLTSSDRPMTCRSLRSTGTYQFIDARLLLFFQGMSSKSSVDFILRSFGWWAYMSWYVRCEGTFGERLIREIL